MGFYGGNKSIEKTQIVFDKIYSSRTAMDAGAATDNVYIRRFVLVSYNNEQEKAEDFDKYTQTYESTVWMKEFNGTNGYKYTYVATLDSVAPTITLVKEASNYSEGLSIVAQSSGYELHIAKPWDFILSPGTPDYIQLKEVIDPTDSNNKVKQLSIQAPSTKDLRDATKAANDAVKQIENELNAFSGVQIEKIQIEENKSDYTTEDLISGLTYSYADNRTSQEDEPNNDKTGYIHIARTNLKDMIHSNQITLETTNWPNNSEATFTQTFTINGLTAESKVFFDGIIYNLSGASDKKIAKKNIDKAASYLYQLETANNTITFFAYQRPETTFTVQISYIL